jgi:hypothetical protein
MGPTQDMRYTALINLRREIPTWGVLDFAVLNRGIVALQGRHTTVWADPLPELASKLLANNHRSKT